MTDPDRPYDALPSPGPRLAAVLATLLLLLAAVLAATSAWIVLVALAYVAVGVLLPRLRLRERPRYVAVLGSGLEAGRMPDLLTRRMDTGIERWAALHAEDPQVRLVLSGGQAPGQPRSEAAAMAEHARSRGVPDAAIVLEDRSRTTEENVAFTRALVADLLGPAAVGVLVTSGYHVPRVADLARSAGLTALLAGAPAVGLPWARVVRHEVVMTLGRHPVVHALAALAVCVVVPAVVVLTR